jgi:hypothetical protein
MKSDLNRKNNNAVKLQSPELKESRSVILFITMLVLCLLLLPEDFARMIIKENGPVEMVTAMAYIVSAGWLLIKSRQGEGRKNISAAVLVLLLGLRELDFHTRFTTMGIFKTRYYVSPAVPLVEKLIVSLIVIAMFAFAIQFGREHYRSFLNGIRQRSGPQMVILFAIVCAFVSKFLDRCPDLIQRLIFVFQNEAGGMAISIMEESIELAIPAFILIAISANRPSGNYDSCHENIPAESRMVFPQKS